MGICNGARVCRQVGASRSGSGAGRATSRLTLLLLVVSLSIGFGLLAPPALGQPPVPMLVHGHAYDANGTPLTPGTPIRALVDGVVYSNDSRVSDATGAYSLLIAGNWMGNGTASETPTIKEGADVGDLAIFAAGDFTNVTKVFNETVDWSPSAVVALDLHLSTPGSLPDDLKIGGIVTQPAQAAVPYVILCNPTSTSVYLSTYYLQTDLPGSYNGPTVALGGSINAGSELKVDLPDAGFLNLTGGALKLVLHNLGGPNAMAGGHDFPVDRVEFNATSGGTLDWEPGSTIMGSAPAPGPGRIMTRSSACTDTNSPRDFVLQRESGLPANSTVSVLLVAPTYGQAVPGGAPFTIRWNLTSNTFRSHAYLRVWVNVSYQGRWVPLLAGAYGAETASWDVPNIAEPNAAVNVTVVDPFGSRASQTIPFAIQLQSPWPLVVAVLIVVVIVAFLLFAFLSRRGSRAAAQTPPPAPTAQPPPSAPAPPTGPSTIAGPPAAETKVCPKCGTQVKAQDDSCFFCGHLFVTPPP